MSLPAKFGFLGAGVMAESIIKGIVNAGLTRSEDLWISDVSTERRDLFKSLGMHTTRDNKEVVQNSDVIVLAVKPDKIVEVIKEFYTQATSNKLFVSIAAGVTLETLEAAFPPSTRVIRVMPNTPCLVSASASTFTPGSFAKEEDTKTVSIVFNAIGVAKEIPESMMNAATGLAGSGPAYVFMFIEALADGGVRMGLTRETARSLAAQTVYGSAKMVLENPTIHPAELRNRVESPGGTTIAGSHALERGGFRNAVIDSVVASAERCAVFGALSKNK